MRFGNWEITENGIVGHNEMRLFEVTRENLEYLRNNSLDMLIHISEKSNVDAKEVFNLNMAFIYALGKFGIESISEVHMANTVQIQNKMV